MRKIQIKMLKETAAFFEMLMAERCWDLPDLTTLDGVPENGDDTEGDEEPVEQVEQVRGF